MVAEGKEVMADEIVAVGEGDQAAVHEAGDGAHPPVAGAPPTT